MEQNSPNITEKPPKHKNKSTKKRRTKSSKTKKTLQLYIAAGLIDDIETLSNAFYLTNSFRYQKFAQEWRNMNFSLVFFGKSGDELTEFCQEAFQIARKYFVEAKTPITQIFGLYLMYGLYFKQPSKTKTRIRFTLQDYEELITFIDELKTNKQFDALFLVYKLIASGAFEHVVNERIMSLGPKYRTYYQKPLANVITLPVKVHRSEKHLKASQLVEALQTLDSQYQTFKSLISTSSRFALGLTDENFHSKVEDVLSLSPKKRENEDEFKDSKTSKESDGEKALSVQKRIKMKAWAKKIPSQN